MGIDQIGVEWIPVAGAAGALIGVLIGLVVTRRRAKRQSRIEREDAVRADARKSVAELLSASKSFQRHGTFLSDSSLWSSAGHDQVLVWATEADEALDLLQQKLVTARLIIIEPRLASDLDGFASTVEEVSAVIQESVKSFGEQRAPGPDQHKSEARWDVFADALANLQYHAIQDLRPTVRERSRRWR